MKLIFTAIFEITSHEKISLKPKKYYINPIVGSFVDLRFFENKAEIRKRSSIFLTLANGLCEDHLVLSCHLRLMILKKTPASVGVKCSL